MSPLHATVQCPTRTIKARSNGRACCPCRHRVCHMAREYNTRILYTVYHPYTHAARRSKCRRFYADAFQLRCPTAFLTRDIQLLRASMYERALGRNNWPFARNAKLAGCKISIPANGLIGISAAHFPIPILYTSSTTIFRYSVMFYYLACFIYR